MTEQQPPGTTEDQGDVVLTQWEFIGRVPTIDEVRSLLSTLPEVWGVQTVDFIDFVQALPQRKKVKKPHPTNPNVTVDEYLDCWTLYMSVAGRIKMLETAAEANSWRVDFRPEPVTPTGLPGYLSAGDSQGGGRLVYRVYVEIAESRNDGPALGSKSGTAWVPASGGSNAAATNPYEKCETSALGRALGAWGFGVLPGSGIASVEEIAGVRENRAHMQAEAEHQPAAGGGRGRATGSRPTRDDLMQETLGLMEQVRLARGTDEPVMMEQVGRYLTERLGVRGGYDDRNAAVDWAKVKDGQLVILANSFRETLAKIADPATGF